MRSAREHINHRRLISGLGPGSRNSSPYTPGKQTEGRGSQHISSNRGNTTDSDEDLGEGFFSGGINP